MRFLVYYAIYKQLTLKLVPVYFIKHLVSCYIYYVYLITPYKLYLRRHIKTITLVKMAVLGGWKSCY